MSAEAVQKIYDLQKECTLEELKKVNTFLCNTIRFNVKKQQVAVAWSFNEGDRVYFFTKHGDKVCGTVKKICQKNIKLRADNGTLWTVTSTLLKKIADNKNMVDEPFAEGEPNHPLTEDPV